MKEEFFEIEINSLKIYGYIYKIVNLDNNKIYVGQSKKINKKSIMNYYGSGKLITQSLKKKNKINFVKCCIDYAFSKEELDNLEIYWINFYNSTDKKVGYNISYGGSGNSGSFGQNNGASKSKMSEEKRKEKALKVAKSRKEKGIGKGENSPCSIKNMGLDKIIIKNKKSHETAKRRGTDKIRIKNMVETKKKNNIFKIAANKAAITIKEKGLLKGKNNPKAKKYKLISPQNEEFIVFGELKNFCKEKKLSVRLLILNLNKGKIKLKKRKYKSILTKNTENWEIILLSSYSEEKNEKISNS